MTFHDLPAVNATLNGLSALLLIAGFIFIKRGNKIAHRNCMVSALISSTVFLACYLTYHFTVKTITHFVEPAWFRPYYLTLLISHTILAVVILPLIIITVTFAAKQNFEKHKKFARWTWPLWLYVSITGVVIYLLLYQIFPQK
jgi:uncharacterized membrane protein YozB (DUF420 family)